MRALILFMTFIYSLPSWATCEDTPMLFNAQSDGQRRIQNDSNMCYAFSLSHALSIITHQYINPIDIASQYKTLNARGYRINLEDFQQGASPTDYDAHFVNVLMAKGLCTKKVDDDILLLLENEFRQDLAKDRVAVKCEEKSNHLDLYREVRSLYQKMIDDIKTQCAKERSYPKGIRPYSMGIRSPAEEEISDREAIRSINKFLDRKSPVVINIHNKLFGKTNSGYHSLTIVGRKENPQTGQCQYRLLDSSPTDYCEKYVTDVLEKDCKNGDLWISEEALQDALISLIGFRFRR